MTRKSQARKARRASYRAMVAKIQREAGLDREHAAAALAETGASWRDFGLAYTGFGAPELGPPVPNSLTWTKDGIPVGRRAD